MKYSLLALLLAVPPVSAEVLVVDKVEQAASVATPRSGMTMDSVRANFGEPQSIADPVGDPPITRWVYPGFSVFFEYNQVIHSVVHRDQ